ncbi:unnamed protein product [Cylindrotheca closterium]|uniref:Uncharacterized protein n=1 Tax=Cylindrotheca closterium TaxID=2856 RepID=A0AAD2G3Y0_9STRA|nr:unnamed protein product [Cylindrotheca closterium]
MSLKTIVANLPFAHLSLTTISIGVGIYGLPPPPWSSDNDNNRHESLLSTKQESFDAKHYDLLTELVTQMYAGRGSHHPHCHFADTAKFQDAAVICKSPKEIHEAFRLHEKLQPKCLRPPICVDVEPKGSSILVTYALNQHYGSLNLDMRSLVQVEVQLRSLVRAEVPLEEQEEEEKEPQLVVATSTPSNISYLVPESDFLVLDVQELWNGNALLGTPLFWIVRRINGILSWHVSSRVFKDD